MLNPAIALVLLPGKLSSRSLLPRTLYLIVPLLAGAVAALLAVYLTPDVVPEEEREEVTAAPARA